MLLLSPLLLLVLRAALFVTAQGVDSGGSNDDHRGFAFPGGSAFFDSTDPCMVVSPPCMSEADRYSLEALRNIHQMVDDDQDGGIEVEESVEFIIEDMKQQQTNKHSNLHREDQHITIEELWRGWKSSEVHNWTQEEVLRWLKEFVELPQYERNFKDFKVNGNTLPRIAANEPSFLSGQLKVLDQRDKQKLNIKALDVVLFGPPTRPPHNYMKDLLLIVSVVMGVGGCWFAQAQNKASKIHIGKMMKDLESLQRAELSLRELQEQLERAQEEKRNVAEEKQNLEDKMRDEIMGAQEEAHRLHELRQGAVSELSRLRYAEEELEQVRGALKQAEKDMQASWSVSEVLQLWLQLTHEVEVQYYNVKRQSAELQLATAKEEAEKIKKKRNTVLGTLHVAHSSSLDQVDHKILEAKNALSEVTSCLRERLHRWQQIERLCGFPIFRNSGLATLTAKLYSEPCNLGMPRVPMSCYSCHSSLEDLLEDPPIVTQISGPPMRRSPRTRGSTICRSRRPGVITQPQSTMISSDPDLLIPMRAPLPCFDEEEGIFRNPQKRQDSQEIFPDSDYAPAPVGRMFPSSSSIDSSSRKIYRDEMELFGDSSIRKSSSKELEASIESPGHKTSVEELEDSADMAIRKMLKDKTMDTSLDNSTVNVSKNETETSMDTASSKMSRDTRDGSLDAPARKVLCDDLEASADVAARKISRDTMGSLMDTASRNIYRDRSDVSQDVIARKMLRNECETSADMATRKLSREMLGASMDSISRQMLQDEFEPQFDSVSRKFTRDSMGMSLDTGSRRLAWDKGEYQLDSAVRGMPRDKMAETVGTPVRKISRDELEYSADSVSRKMLPRDKMEALIDSSSRKVSRERQELGLESSASWKILRDELEMSTSSLRGRIPRDKIDSSIDTPTGKISLDKVDLAMEIPKQRLLREDFVASEPGSSPGRLGQPDLTITSIVPWKSPSELVSPGPLSQLVYDGILEKSCAPMATTPTSPSGLSASTPNLPQSMLIGEVEPPPLPPPRVRPSPNASPTGGCEERTKEKEKSKKSSKLKNLFKKKKDSTSERPQSGLQNL